MRKLAFLVIAMIAGHAGTVLAAENTLQDVCLVTFSDADHAKALDVRAVAIATVVPRFSGEKLASAVAKVFVYADTPATVTACQCLGSPAPANSMVERDQTLLACPKPLSTQ